MKIMQVLLGMQLGIGLLLGIMMPKRIMPVQLMLEIIL